MLSVNPSGSDGWPESRSSESSATADILPARPSRIHRTVRHCRACEPRCAEGGACGLLALALRLRYTLLTWTCC